MSKSVNNDTCPRPTLQVLDKLARDTLDGTIRGLVRQAFQLFDVNGDGVLEASEFKKW